MNTNPWGPTPDYVKRLLLNVGITALVIILALLLWRASHVFLLAFAGLLFGVFLLTFAGFLSRHTPLKGRWSLLAVLLLLLVFLGGVGWLVGPRLANQLNQLTGQISQPLQRIEETLTQYGWGDWLLERAPLLEAPEQNAEQGQPTAGEQAQGREAPLSGINIVSQITGIVSSLLSIFAALFFVAFVGIFLAADPELYRSGVVRLFPHDRRERAGEVMDELGRTLQGWLLGQLVSMTIVGVLTGLGLWLLGVPLVLVLAFLAFLLEFIPIVGPWLSGVPAVLLALSQGPTQALWVALLYLAIQQLEGNLILPLVQQRAVDLPPMLTLLAVFLMGTLFGFVGLLVATPLMAVILVLVKMLYLRDILGDSVKLPRRARQG